ncbi:hypothetical protein [[Scytonema hofmanni] UTEX B 1581]|uniref:hypothetical protein n=1 Tax=[Scytonema hofmanni] UTEX B 1581 TaxID=379535 RepID=UPI0011832AA8|nr:hypothetical protein [[Scytonema hofmanni] UTEX B 1581]
MTIYFSDSGNRFCDRRNSNCSVNIYFGGSGNRFCDRRNSNCSVNIYFGDSGNRFCDRRNSNCRLKSGAEYPVWSPYDAVEAVNIMLKPLKTHLLIMRI